MNIHRRLVFAIISAIWPYAALTIFQNFFSGGGLFEFSVTSLFYFTAGLIYTHFFEWYFHHGPMHDPNCKLPGFIKNGVRRSHADHHRVFRDDNFRSRNPEALNHITTRWHVFSVLIGVHYGIFVLVLPVKFAPIFFLGVTLHFICYEICHWFTHVADNGFDKIIAKVPVLSNIRARQIKHHQTHHSEPVFDFNFTPPYLGDELIGTRKNL